MDISLNDSSYQILLFAQHCMLSLYSNQEAVESRNFAQVLKCMHNYDSFVCVQKYEKGCKTMKKGCHVTLQPLQHPV